MHDARRVLRFLQVTQDADGHWCQNMWLDGSPYWTGIQMDEAALPVLLVDLAARCGALRPGERERVLAHDPARGRLHRAQRSGQSRRIAGKRMRAIRRSRSAPRSPRSSSPPTMPTRNGHPGIADLSPRNRRRLERVARRLDVRHATPRWPAAAASTGYYVRVAEPDQADAASPKHGFVPIKNRPPAESSASAALMVSPDALALVRFGLRAADDPRIVNTVKVIDALLKVDTPRGPSWHRYNGDGYGEHDDGSPFDGTG